MKLNYNNQTNNIEVNAFGFINKGSSCFACVN